MPKIPCLAAAAVFTLAALLIARFAISPLGPADLLGIAACAAAAGAAATLAYAPRPPAREDDALVEKIAERAAQRVTAALDATPARREPTTDLAADAPAAGTVTSITDLPAPGAAGKSRLGRGVAGLIQGTSFSPKPEDKPAA